MMRRPKSENVPNQGCAIFFIMVVSVFFFLSIPVLRFFYAMLFEKHILLSSDSPDETYHVEVSRRGSSNDILIEETTTSAELKDFITTELWMSVEPEHIVIEWISDSVAEIIVTGRDDAQNHFLFDADAEDEKIQRRQPKDRVMRFSDCLEYINLSMR